MSIVVGLIFLLIGIVQSNGCSAGIFVINKYRNELLHKSFEDELAKGNKKLLRKVLTIGRKRKGVNDL